MGDLTAVESWIFYAVDGGVTFGFPLLFLTYLWLRRRFVPSGVCACFAFVWGLVHNPSPVLPRYCLGQVIWSSGCGMQDDDLLVQMSGRIYRAKGRALLSDKVDFDGARLRRVTGFTRASDTSNEQSLWCRVGLRVRSRLQTRLRNLEPDVSAWLRAFVLGEQATVSTALLETFRSVGLLHLLVLSGGHLSVVATMVRVSFRLPWQIFYINGRLSATAWLKVVSISQPLTLLILLTYCAATGFSQSMQRALLCCSVNLIPPMLGMSQSVQGRILLAVALQAIFFPTNFLSLSMLMSWCGVLLLTAFVESTFLKSYPRIMMDAVLVQSVFFGFSLIFFGRVGVLAIPANFVFQIIFAALLPFDLIALAVPGFWFDGYVAAINRAVVSWIGSIAEIQSVLPLSEISIPEIVTVKHVGGRALVTVLMLALFVLIGLRQQADSKS